MPLFKVDSDIDNIYCIFDYYDLLATLASGALTYLAFYIFKPSSKH